jgi:signal transduction histidine kinase/CheY-like chemotaxis protein
VRSFWQISEEHLLVEQLRLLLRNVIPSLFTTFPLVGILVWALSVDSNRQNMVAWAALVIASRLLTVWHARRTLAADLSGGRARREVAILMLLNVLDGVIWGALAWAALDSATLVGSVLVISVMAGVANSAMSALAVVPPVFFAFSLFALSGLALKLWLMPDPAYGALAGISAVYIAVLLAQARIGAHAARAAIHLRFENRDLIERLRVETNKAHEAHREAELANLAKTKFLAAASHDLRQPIHAQGLFIDVLSHTPLSPHQREVLASTRSAWLATSDMLNTLLDFSRIEAGVVHPTARPFLLQRLLHTIENDLAPLADAKGLVYRSRETSVAVHSDATLVEMIVRNLVSNAIRYTDHGGVLVACRRHGNVVAVEVWDTGIGIAQDDQKDIFSEFHQLGNPERDRNKGLGLGLAIAQGLAKTLGHDLTMASRPGRGSVFRLTLPVAHAMVIKAPSPPVGRRLEKLRVLVIDDDAAVRSAMAQLLQSWGCQCDTADSIEEALISAHLACPDILISDYRLRELRTGAQAIAELRAFLGPHTPALMITGDTAPERLREALASGIPLMHKPVKPEQLYQALVDVLA